MTRFMTSMLIALSLMFTSAAALADKQEEKRIKINTMREEVLNDLYKERPQAKAEIDESEGYAVFSNVGIQVFLLGAGGGQGVVRDRKTGVDTYMSMATAALGLGLGVKDFRAVFIFHDRKALEDFTDNGWDFSGAADAAAVAEDKGGEIGEAGSIRKKVSVYQFTENGLALQATLNGTKYWKNKKLNRTD
mgnify:CR=1 FL=1